MGGFHLDLATLDDVGNAAALAASDLARTMTASVLNITCGAYVDESGVTLLTVGSTGRQGDHLASRSTIFDAQAPPAVTIASVAKPASKPIMMPQVVSSLAAMRRLTASSSMTT